MLNVLVIDDSLTIRGIIESVLAGDGGCRVIGPAADVEEARRFLRDCRPDVITLDLALPGMDGMAFLDELKGISHPPVVVVSGSTPPGSLVAKEAVGRGAAACFDKSQLVKDARRLLRLLHGTARSGA